MTNDSIYAGVAYLKKKDFSPVLILQVQSEQG